jgi:flagellar hook-associated protein 2
MMATDVISALGAGSGMDVKALATSLVDAERVPRKDIIDKKIKAAENGISGYASIKYVLDGLRAAFTALKDQSDFNTGAPRNSQPSAVSVTASGSAASGTHNITVTQLARPQKLLSEGFASNSVSLNSDATFDLTLSVNNGTAETITVPEGSDTPKGIVAAINAAGKGVTAQLINTGDATAPYKIILTGTTGSNNNFSLSSDVSGVSFDTSLQTSANAIVNVDGIDLQPSSNKLTGLVPGMTLEFLATTTGAATFEVMRDKDSVKSKLEALVLAYNDANAMLGVVSDPKSTVEGYGASLVGNPTVNSIKNQIRELVFTDSNSPSGGLTNLRDLGISIDRYGTMSLDKTKLDTVLVNNFEDAVTLLTNNQDNLSTFSPTNAGAAGEAVKKLTAMLTNTGVLTTQSANLTKRITDYKAELDKLELRMTQLMNRYNKQFGVMENIVGQSKSMRTSLTNTFEGMMAAYK